MLLPVTALYAIPLALILVVLFFGVTLTRSKMNLSIGDGGDTALHERIRRHGNFVEWTPMVLLLMALAEINGASALWLHLAGILLVVGRVLHPLGLKADQPTNPLRIAGNVAAIAATIILVVVIGLRLLAG